MVSSCEIDSLFCEDSTLDNVIAPPATLRALTDILLYVVLTPTLNVILIIMLKQKPLLFSTLNAIIFRKDPCDVRQEHVPHSIASQTHI